MISVIINSAALGERSRSVLSSVGKPYGERAALLKEKILPKVVGVPGVEVIVVGEYEAGEGYTYVPSPSVAFDATDALKQRTDGLAASHGDIVVFQHDDHVLDAAFFQYLQGRYGADDAWDVLVPARWAYDGETVRLNNGSGDGYVMGHACVIRRAMAEKTPWSLVDKVFTWDVSHTLALRANGARIRFVDDLIVWDLEGRAPGYGW